MSRRSALFGIGPAVAVLAALTLATVSLAQDSLETLKAMSEKGKAALDAERETACAEAMRSYSNALSEAHDRYQKKGDLTGVVACRAERARLAESGALPAKSEPGCPELIVAAQLRCSKATAEAETLHDKKLAELWETYAKRLTDLKRELVRQNMIDAAMDVENVLKGVEFLLASREVLAATEKPAPEESTKKPRLSKWTFDGKDVRMFSSEGTGEWMEKSGCLTVASFGAGKGWHGPEARKTVRPQRDFTLTGTINYQSAGAEIGRILLGVVLADGRRYAVVVGDQHTDTVECFWRVQNGDKSATETKVKYAGELIAGQPMTVSRKGDTLRCLVGGVTLVEMGGVTTSQLTEIFVAIERFENYPPLTRAEVLDLTLAE